MSGRGGGSRRKRHTALLLVLICCQNYLGQGQVRSVGQAAELEAKAKEGVGRGEMVKKLDSFVKSESAAPAEADADARRAVSLAVGIVVVVIVPVVAAAVSMAVRSVPARPARPGEGLGEIAFQFLG